MGLSLHVVHASPILLSTPRLTLRRLQRGDEGSLVAYRSLPEVARLQSWEDFSWEDATRLVAEQCDRQPGVPGTWLQLAVVDRSTQKLIGDVGLHFGANEAQQTELGVTFAPNWQKQGFATEALRCVLDFLFIVMEQHRVFAVMGAENLAAASLFGRLGFRQEGHFIEHRWFKGGWDSELLFAMLRREWAVIQGAKIGTA